MLAYMYVEAPKVIANGQATKILLPYEASGVLAGIAAAGLAFKEGEEGAAKA